jgi:hypothetical protein
MPILVIRKPGNFFLVHLVRPLMLPGHFVGRLLRLPSQNRSLSKSKCVTPCLLAPNKHFRSLYYKSVFSIKIVLQTGFACLPKGGHFVCVNNHGVH